MAIANKKMARDIHYKTFSQRLSRTIIDWLFSEKTKYPSWNKFFEEIKKRYEQK